MDIDKFLIYNKYKKAGVTMFDKKMALFYMVDIFKEYTDKDHCLTQQEIIDKLFNIYQLSLERKTVASNIELLIENGYDINKIHGQGYYLGERDLDENEIKFLIDAVYSSKMITGKQAKNISKKIYSNLSMYEQKDFSYIHKSTDINRTTNNNLFLNMEILSEAIEKRKMISFKYLSYDKKGNLTERKFKDSGKPITYTLSPYFLVNNFSKYYLIANNKKFNNHVYYRVDYMSDIEITDQDIIPYENVETLGKDFNITKHINDHVYMFGGKVITAKIEISNEKTITDVKDWFGDNASIYEQDGKIYANIKSDDKAFFYWALQYQENIKVLEPDYIVNRIIESLENNLKKYKN